MDRSFQYNSPLNAPRHPSEFLLKILQILKPDFLLSARLVDDKSISIEIFQMPRFPLQEIAFLSNWIDW